MPIERLVEAIARAQERRVERLEGLRMAETAKMAALGRMAEGVAHEINNPVNVMVSLAGWMDDLVADLSEQTEKALGQDNCKAADTLLELAQSAAKLHEHGLRVKQTTAKLLCLCHEAQPGAGSRSGAGARTRPGKAEADTDLYALIQGLLAEREQRLAEAQITALPLLATDLPALNMPLSGLSSGPVGANLATALGNILDNALEAMPSGGTLTLAARVEAGEVVITIEDTGRGISPAHLPRIFEPFFSTKEVGLGPGLGLSISYGVIKGLGGDILVDSREGQGTKVLVRLPVAQAPADTAASR